MTHGTLVPWTAPGASPSPGAPPSPGAACGRWANLALEPQQPEEEKPDPTRRFLQLRCLGLGLVAVGDADRVSKPGVPHAHATAHTSNSRSRDGWVSVVDRA